MNEFVTNLRVIKGWKALCVDLRFSLWQRAVELHVSYWEMYINSSIKFLSSSSENTFHTVHIHVTARLWHMIHLSMSTQVRCCVSAFTFLRLFALIQSILPKVTLEMNSMFSRFPQDKGYPVTSAMWREVPQSKRQHVGGLEDSLQWVKTQRGTHKDTYIYI